MMETKDPVNQSLIAFEQERGLEKLGLMNSVVWHQDPKRLVFTLSRYKFVAKMLSGKESVAEIGCGDGFGARIVRQEVKSLTITDYDPYFINRFSEIASDVWSIEAKVHDILEEPLSSKFDAVYSLDVLEHIPPEREESFIRNISSSLKPNGVMIAGIPSLESQEYASPSSRAGHVNCKSGKDFKSLMEHYFEHVFLFSMNDEVVHTGFSKMAHYLLVLCCVQK
ncbi:class I SAM-dependent methyltransferase [bacterium]|nr:class I SAM-dependent methyltransferase [bacterium]